MTLLGLIEQASPSIQRLFACDCAERALLRERALGREPHKDSWEAVRIARLFAKGKATEKELAAAREAAREVYWAASADGVVAWAASAAAWAASAATRLAELAADRAANAAEKEKEEAWQVQHLQSMLDALKSPRATLLSVLQQRQRSLSWALSAQQSHLEEVLF